jgi:hypothetical protein
MSWSIELQPIDSSICGDHIGVGEQVTGRLRHIGDGVRMRVRARGARRAAREDRQAGTPRANLLAVARAGADVPVRELLHLFKAPLRRTASYVHR